MATVLIEQAVESNPDAPHRRFEVIDGIPVEKIVGVPEVRLANRIAFRINHHSVPLRIGLADIEVMINIGHPRGNRYCPDLIYVSDQRWAFDLESPPGPAWSVIPDLAAEVVSPSNTAEEIQEKIDVYLKAGIRQVWVIHPKKPCVYIHDGSKVVRVVEIDDTLEGGAIIPGFQLPLSVLFPNKVEPAP